MLGALAAAKAAAAPPQPGRRAPPALPRVLFAYDKGQRAVLGLFVVSECARVDAKPGVAFWRVERWVELAAPCVLSADDISWQSTLVHCTARCEERLRHLETSIGGRAFEHFTEWAASRWRLWPVTPQQLDALRGGGAPVTMESDVKLARALNVEPKLERHDSRI